MYRWARTSLFRGVSRLLWRLYTLNLENLLFQPIPILTPNSWDTILNPSGGISLLRYVEPTVVEIIKASDLVVPSTLSDNFKEPQILYFLKSQDTKTPRYIHIQTNKKLIIITVIVFFLPNSTNWYNKICLNVILIKA